MVLVPADEFLRLGSIKLCKCSSISQTIYWEGYCPGTLAGLPWGVGARMLLACPSVAVLSPAFARRMISLQTRHY